MGAYKKWLLADRIAPWTTFITEDEKDIFENITMSQGGFDGPVKSYKSLMRDYNAADEKGKSRSNELSYKSSTKLILSKLFQNPKLPLNTLFCF